MEKLTRITATLLALICCAAVSAQPSVRFNEDGTFKVVQFTDLHFIHDREESRIALERIQDVITGEHPDLVVITGDIVYSSPAEPDIRTVLRTVASFGVPFCITFGNHDDQFDLTKGQLYDIARSYPGCVMPDRGETLSPDYAVRVLGHDGGREAAVLYCIDSNAHIFDSDGKFVSYDFIKESQVERYRAASRAFTQAAGGRPLPALAFFHIPLPEFKDAVTDESAHLVGTRMEAVCSPEHNSGLFKAFKECGDVMGVFVGHDHDNDYAVLWQDILLAYGRFTGGNTEYNHLPNGARVIVLREGERSFDTYIRLADGQIINSISYGGGK